MTATLKATSLFSFHFSFFVFLLFLLASCRVSDGWDEPDGEKPPASGIVVPGSGLEEKLGWLYANARSGGGYIVEINQDESVYQTFLYFLNRINVTVTIQGIGTKRNITLLSRGNLFYVAGGVTLILANNITLKGYDDNIYPLVYIAPGGVFIMNTGSGITGNISGVTGGVYLDGGTFTMNGGAIFANSGGNICGSGVNVTAGTFTMNDGTISGNYAGSGGTVTLIGGNFIMNGGNISGNTARCGGAVMLNRGTFTMNGGTISGNTAAINGGAVTVGVEGAFTMRGGRISDNAAKAYGGAVYVGLTGDFHMNGGTIFGNTAAYYGWGVYVNGTFTKAGGTISGYTGGAGSANNIDMEKSGDLGLAVYAYSNSGVRKRRETTAGPEANLFYSGRNGAYSGEWDL